MKNIGLNHMQATKFLEMCTKLFPDNHDENSYYLDDDKFLDLWVPDPEVHTGHRLIKIYWFEFCMTYLSIAIYRKLFDFSASNGYITADTGEEHSYEWSANFYRNVLFLIMNPDRITDIKTKWHPVDYLYEEFLKLN